MMRVALYALVAVVIIGFAVLLVNSVNSQDEAIYQAAMSDLREDPLAYNWMAGPVVSAIPRIRPTVRESGCIVTIGVTDDYTMTDATIDHLRPVRYRAALPVLEGQSCRDFPEGKTVLISCYLGQHTKNPTYGWCTNVPLR